ncbi:MAG: GTPase HflX [Pirellulales bacterium]|nr:GTPase HflX [Pirellulales bacterium]
MTELNRTQGVASESAILAGVQLPDTKWHEEPLDELAGLVNTAGAVVVGRLHQKRIRPDRTTYLGKGKVEQLHRMVQATDADLVIFDNDLSPAQTRNLEESLGVKVLDRTEVILDIFAFRAQTHEARLAVELAQLEYSLPRLKRMWTHLSRMKMGVGMRGPGEQQLETDRRLVEKRIQELRHELGAIQRRKERQVAARSDRRTVSIVGYTNAGKSTLMNTLTGADVLVEDQLFATLDTRTRRWHLPGWGPVLLSDTVGFIRHLPHRLIASFKATLEEARQADLLLHVADASNPAVIDQIAAVYDVLEEIGIEEKNTVLVLNKIDRLNDGHSLDPVLHCYPNAIRISAVTGDGLQKMASAVSEALSRHFLNLDIETDVRNGRLLAYLADKGEILSRTYQDERVRIHCRIDRQYLGKIRDHEAVIRPHNGNGNILPPDANSRLDSPSNQSTG